MNKKEKKDKIKIEKEEEKINIYSNINSIKMPYESMNRSRTKVFLTTHGLGMISPIKSRN